MDGEFCLLNVKASGIHGTGCYAAGTIPAGKRVAEYTGERLERDEAVRREDPASERHSIYVFSAGDGLYIDAQVCGNASRFINHSCEPNCRITKEEGRVYVVTMREIGPGEELTYDYDHDEEYKMPCLCGSPHCRGRI